MKWFSALLFLAPTWGNTPVPIQTKQAPNASIPRSSEKNPWIAGRLLIQFKTGENNSAGIRSCPHCLFRNNQTFRSASSHASDSLDHLFTRYRPTAITPLFRKESEEGKGREPASVEILRNQWNEKWNSVRARYSKRSARVMSNSLSSELIHVYRVELDTQTDLEQAAAEFSRDPHVEFAHPDYILSVANDNPGLTPTNPPEHAFPNDPYFYSQGAWGQNYADLWGLKKIEALSVWENENNLGEGIVVAVVDTGLDYTHPDIAENLWINLEEGVSSDGIDQDGNGLVDDGFGWNFVECTRFDPWSGQCLEPAIPNPDPLDLQGHGTHVSGTIAAIGNNSFGVIGVAPKAHIMALKALNDHGQGSASDLAEALVYAALNGADIVNNSWGCSQHCQSIPAFEGPVTLAYNLGVILVFSAGNNNDDAAYYYPQNAAETFTVAATDHLDSRCNFSNHGPDIDVAAPGGESSSEALGLLSNSILSLRAANTDLFAFNDPNVVGQMIVGEYFYRARGTSMAAPHVSGALALLMKTHPDWDLEELRSALKLSADPASNLGPDPFSQYGRLNVKRASDTPKSSLMKANIISPRSGSIWDWLSIHSTPVTGSASGENFHHYQLSYRRRYDPPEPVQWIPIGGPIYTPVENGPLGTWDWSGQEVGRFVVKLTVTDIDGREYSDIVYTFVECDVNEIPIVAASDNTFCDRIRISWNQVPLSDGYLIQKAPDPNFNMGCEHCGPIALVFGVDFYDDFQVEPGIPYYYKIWSYNPCHTLHWSNVDSGVSSFIPQVVSGVSASDGQYCDYVQVTWNAVPGASQYKVWRSPVNLPSSAFTVGVANSGQTYHNDYALFGSEVNYYWVTVGQNGCDPLLGFGTPDTGSRAHPSIGVPMNVEASDGNWCDKIRVTWQAASNAQNYKIWRSTNSSFGSAIQVGTDNASPFFDTSATAGVVYWYWVEAENDCDLDTISPIPDSGVFGPPLTPSSIDATDGEHCGFVRVTWSSSDDADNYKVYRGPNSNFANAILRGESSGNYLDDPTATPGTSYYYFVRATNNCGESNASAGNLGYRPIAPGVVQNVVATNGASCSYVRVVWDPFPTATSYNVYRSATNNSNTAFYIGFANADDDPFYHDQTAAPGTHYFYWVKAANDCGLSANYSNSNEGWRCTP